MHQSGSSRRIGRVRAVIMAAPVLDLSQDPRAGSDLHIGYQHGNGGSLALRFEDDGALLATYLLAGEAHLDSHYGRHSMPSSTHCYGSQLEVAPAARGRGLGARVVLAARAAAAEHFGRGVMCIVERSNSASRHCNRVAGLVETTRVDGVRFGGRVHWLSAREVRP